MEHRQNTVMAFFYSASQIVSIKSILKSNMTSWLQSIALEPACLNSNAGSAFDYIGDQWLSFSICNTGWCFLFHRIVLQIKMRTYEKDLASVLGTCGYSISCRYIIVINYE